MSRVRRPTRATVVRALAALGAGACICLSVPPFGWWPLAPIGIAAWAVLNVRATWQARYRVGALVGLAWFLPSTLWMLRFTPAAWPIGVAVWFPLITGTVSALCPPNRMGPAALAGWLVLSEWFRWHAPFGGVPLSMLCMTQSRGPLLPLARMGGPLAISLTVALAGAVLAWLADAVWTRDWSRTGPATVIAGLIAISIGVALALPRSTDIGALAVAAVQGGGPQETRSYNTDPADVLERHLEASRLIGTPVDLVLWPENVVNVTRWEGSSAQRQIQDTARELGATMVVGVVESADSTSFYNSAVAIDPDGRQVDRVEKARRVPFGEYVPLRGIIQPVASAVGQFIPGRDARVGNGPAVLRTDLGTFGVLISWETFFWRRGRNAVQNGAELMLNPTNGSSYWLTQVQSQQLAMSELRAAETDRWVVQAAPTGFSAIITPDGRIVARTGISEQKVLQQEVTIRTGRSLAVRVGDIPALGLAAVCALWPWLVTGRRRRGPAPGATGGLTQGEQPSTPDGTAGA